MIMFIFGIIGLLFIIGVISLLADFENSVVTCLFGIIGIFCLYAIISGVMDFMFWLGYIIGPYSIIVTILLILSPFIVLYFYDKLKSNSYNSFTNNIKKNKTAIVSIIVALVIILFILVPVLTYNPWDSDASSQVEEYYVDASSEPYTVDCPEGFEIGNGGTTRYEYFGHDFVNDTIYWGDGYCAISVNHHDANGKSLNHYLKVLKQGDMVKVYKVKKTTVDGNKGYKITGNFLDEDTSWVMFIHDDEYYLINFENVPKTIQKEFLNSFKFK